MLIYIFFNGFLKKYKKFVKILLKISVIVEIGDLHYFFFIGKFFKKGGKYIESSGFGWSSY